MSKFSWFGRKRIVTEKSKEKTLKQLCQEAFGNELKKNPELMRKVAFKEMGYADMIEDTNPASAQRTAIKNRVYEKALKQIEEDPDLAERFVGTAIEDIMSDGRKGRRGRDFEVLESGSGGSSISQALEDIKSLEELKEALGSKGSGLASLVTPELLIEVLRTVRDMSAKNTPQVEIPVYVVQVDGQMTKVTEPQYKQLLQEGRVKPLGAIEAPKAPVGVKVESKPVSEAMPGITSVINADTQETPLDVLSSIEPEELAGYLAMLPEEFVDNLRGEGSTRSEFLIGVLTKATPEKIIEWITPYEDDANFGRYVKHLCGEGKPWLVKVLEILHG